MAIYKPYISGWFSDPLWKCHGSSLCFFHWAKNAKTKWRVETKRQTVGSSPKRYPTFGSCHSSTVNKQRSWTRSTLGTLKLTNSVYAETPKMTDGLEVTTFPEVRPILRQNCWFVSGSVGMTPSPRAKVSSEFAPRKRKVVGHQAPWLFVCFKRNVNQLLL